MNDQMNKQRNEKMNTMNLDIYRVQKKTTLESPIIGRDTQDSHKTV